jgi:hypothetical protein
MTSGQTLSTIQLPIDVQYFDDLKKQICDSARLL